MRRLSISFVLFTLCGSVNAADYRIVDLGTLGGVRSFAYALNDKGRVVGESACGVPGYSHAFVSTPLGLRDLGVLGGTGSGALGLNSRGHATGSSAISADPNQAHAFYFSGGRMLDLGTLGGSVSQGYSVNDLGQVAGLSYIAGDATFHAFLYAHGVMQDLGTLGGSSSYASHINQRGQVIGSASTADDAEEHLFRYENGAMVDLGVPAGAAYAYAQDASNEGHIAVTALPADGSYLHAFGYHQGEFTDLGTLGGDYAIALGVNDAGDYVGASDVMDGNYLYDHAFLYTNGVMVDLNDRIPPDSGWTFLESAYDINNRGQITGSGFRNGQYRAFLLTPVGQRPSALSELPATVADTAREIAEGVGQRVRQLVTGSMPRH